MRYLGAALVILAAALIASGYKDRLSRAADTLGELLRLLRFVRSRVTCALEPPEVWARGYVTECAPVSRFVGYIAEGSAVWDAYGRVSGELDLPTEAQKTVRELFSSLGGLDVGADERALAAAEERLDAILREKRREVEERGRLAMAFALLISVGGALVII